MTPRIYATVYGFINICKYLRGSESPYVSFWLSQFIRSAPALGKEPFQGKFKLDFVVLPSHTFVLSSLFIDFFSLTQIVAGQNKHLEAFDSGCATGDMEYALTNLYLYINTGIYGCGDNLKNSCQNAR